MKIPFQVPRWRKKLISSRPQTSPRKQGRKRRKEAIDDKAGDRHKSSSQSRENEPPRAQPPLRGGRARVCIRAGFVQTVERIRRQQGGGDAPRPLRGRRAGAAGAGWGCVGVVRCCAWRLTPIIPCRGYDRQPPQRCGGLLATWGQCILLAAHVTGAKEMTGWQWCVFGAVLHPRSCRSSIITYKTWYSEVM